MLVHATRVSSGCSSLAKKLKVQQEIDYWPYAFNQSNRYEWGINFGSLATRIRVSKLRQAKQKPSS
jgi:hypothetical protein